MRSLLSTHPPLEIEGPTGEVNVSAKVVVVSAGCSPTDGAAMEVEEDHWSKSPLLT